MTDADQRARALVDAILSMVEKVSGRTLRFRLVVDRDGRSAEPVSLMTELIAAALRQAQREALLEAAEEIRRRIEEWGSRTGRPPCGGGMQATVDATLSAENVSLRQDIEAHGGRRCDIPACNCERTHWPACSERDAPCTTTRPRSARWRSTRRNAS